VPLLSTPLLELSNHSWSARGDAPFAKEYLICHSLYHMYEIMSISIALEWVLWDNLYFFPYEVKNRELKSICIGGHDS
jgi:hypothetical protein